MNLQGNEVGGRGRPMKALGTLIVIATETLRFHIGCVRASDFISDNICMIYTTARQICYVRP